MKEDRETGDREWSREEILGLPVWKYKGPVQVIRSDEVLHDILDCLKRENLLGFDIECRPAFRRGESYPVAVVQLAGESMVFLIQLKFLKSLLPLAKIFSSPGIIKAGVGIDDDLRKLRELMPFPPAGFIELGKIAAAAGINAGGVRTLAARLMGVRISKGGARLSNWERDVLTPAQITYAATDAWICRQIYLNLQEKI